MRGRILARIAVAAATAGSATAFAQQNGPILLPPTSSPAPPDAPSDPDPQSSDAVLPALPSLPADASATPSPSRGSLILPTPPAPFPISGSRPALSPPSDESEGNGFDLPALEGPKASTGSVRRAPSSSVIRSEPPPTSISAPAIAGDGSAEMEEYNNEPMQPRTRGASPRQGMDPAAPTGRSYAPSDSPNSARSTNPRANSANPNAAARSAATRPANPPQTRYQIQPQPRSDQARNRFNPLGFLLPNRNPPPRERRPQQMQAMQAPNPMPVPAPSGSRGTPGAAAARSTNPPKTPTATTTSGRAPRPAADPNRDALIKRQMEHRIDALAGPRLSRLSVNVRSGVIEVRARPYFFWQKRGLRRDLEDLPAIPGYRMTLEVE